MTIAGRLTQRRTDIGLTQYELADATGIARSQLAGYEQGRHEPSLAALVTLADALGVTADWLLGRAGVPEPAKPPRRAKATKPAEDGKNPAARPPRPTEAMIEAVQVVARSLGKDYCSLDGYAYRWRRGGWERV